MRGESTAPLKQQCSDMPHNLTLAPHLSWESAIGCEASILAPCLGGARPVPAEDVKEKITLVSCKTCLPSAVHGTEQALLACAALPCGWIGMHSVIDEVGVREVLCSASSLLLQREAAEELEHQEEGRAQ